MLGSLARSYKLKEVGTTSAEDISYTEPINVFRESKRGGFRVQRARYSLASIGERKEIQMFKRQKSGRSKWFS